MLSFTSHSHIVRIRDSGRWSWSRTSGGREEGSFNFPWELGMDGRTKRNRSLITYAHPTQQQEREPASAQHPLAQWLHVATLFWNSRWKKMREVRKAAAEDMEIDGCQITKALRIHFWRECRAMTGKRLPISFFHWAASPFSTTDFGLAAKAGGHWTCEWRNVN